MIHTPEQLQRIRVKCAEEMGWTNIHSFTVPLPISGTYPQWIGTNPKGAKDNLPNFPSDANAALQLVDFLAKPENGKWGYCVSGNAEYCLFAFSNGKEFVVANEPLPFATACCIAFLRARGINPDEI